MHPPGPAEAVVLNDKIPRRLLCHDPTLSPLLRSHFCTLERGTFPGKHNCSLKKRFVPRRPVTWLWLRTFLLCVLTHRRLVCIERFIRPMRLFFFFFFQDLSGWAGEARGHFAAAGTENANTQQSSGLESHKGKIMMWGNLSHSCRVTLITGEIRFQFGPSSRSVPH